MEAEPVRYSAFISYNHRNRRWANWLHRQLETYRIPANLHGLDSPVGTIGPRLPPVFQDREELASSADLAESVREALSQSATLIVICSPNAVGSHWVNEEIRTFHALGRASQIKCLIVGGEPHATRNPALDPALECFPPALFERGTFEPLAADLRPGRDGKQAATLKLIAGLLAVDYDMLRQREAMRRHKRLVLLTAASIVGFLVMSGLTIFALLQRSTAIAQRDLARQKTMTAERTVDFVKSMFAVSDPSEAKGATITAREVLDRGARQIDGSLANEPEVKAELTTTLGEVYGGLGLFGQSDNLLRQSLSIKGLSLPTRARQWTALGESQRRLGAFKESIASYNRALTIVREQISDKNDLEPRILTGLSQSLSFAENYSAANTAAVEALRQISDRRGTVDLDAAPALEAIGVSAMLEGQLEPAKNAFARAIAIRRSTQSALHPQITENLNQLGDISYLLRNNTEAERYYRQVLKNDAIVLGDNHPDAALTLNNLSRVLLEQRKFKEAQLILDDAIRVQVRQFDETNFNLIFPFANLAIVKHGLGNPRAAEPLFRKALTAARLHKHRNLAPILTDLADTLCDMGRTTEAMPLLAEARPIMATTYPNDPWRPAWTDFVRGRCLIKSGNRTDGLALIRASAPALQKRWKPDSLYGYQVAQQLRIQR
jgi:tetratricopeptide (TPR) repeat protein